MLPRHLNKEDMSLHCTMCHRSCETGSSSSFALTSVKFTWDVTKTPLMGAGAKFPNAVPCCKFFLWKVGARWVVLAIAWCWGVLLKGEQPFQWAASSVACLKRSRQCSQLPECGNERGISFPPFVSFLSHFSFFCYMHHFFFFICMVWQYCRGSSAAVCTCTPVFESAGTKTKSCEQI